MIPGSSFLQTIWLAVGAHLWQTTLVLIPLFLLGWVMRNAPARLIHALWWLGLAKLFLPLPLLGPLGRRTLKPFLDEVVVTSGGTGVLSTWLEKASRFLDPVAVAVGRERATPPSVESLFVVLTGVWALGAAWLGFRWIRRRSRETSTTGVSIAQCDPSLSRRLGAALRGTGIPASAVRISSGFAMPAVAGLLRPRIVLPESVVRGLPTGELCAILLHENEHRRRLDPLRLAIARCGVVAFFYYPLLWPLLRRLHTSGEIACDEAAVRAGIEPSAYARALARTLRLGLLPAATPAAAGPGGASLIRRRLHRLKQQERYTAMKKHRFALGAAAVFVALFSFAPFSPLANTEEGAEVTMPKIMTEWYVAPQYPDDAKEDAAEGTVLLEVLVTKDGEPGKIVIKEGVPDYPSFAENAVKAVRRWKFEPATQDGKPVDLTIAIPVAFRLDDEDKGDGPESPSEPAASEHLTIPKMLPQYYVPPQYPEDARKKGLEGRVVLEVLVTKQGRAAEASIKEGVPECPSFWKERTRGCSRMAIRTRDEGPRAD